MGGMFSTVMTNTWVERAYMTIGTVNPCLLTFKVMSVLGVPFIMDVNILSPLYPRVDKKNNWQTSISSPSSDKL